jgi:multidrug efflux pump subunit AcrB
VNRLALAVLAAAGYIALAMVYMALRPSLGSWQGMILLVATIPLVVFTVTVVLGIRRSNR